MDHFDLPSLRALESQSTRVVTAAKTGDLLRAKRYGRSRGTWLGRDGARIGDISVRAFEVNHWGARMRSDTYRGFNGYLIETPRYRVVFGGDTAMTTAFPRVAFVAASGSRDHADRRVQSLDPRALHAGAGCCKWPMTRARNDPARASSDISTQQRAGIRANREVGARAREHAGTAGACGRSGRRFIGTECCVVLQRELSLSQ